MTLARMTYSQHITATELSAYFECRTKAALVAQSFTSAEPDVVSDLCQQYKLAARPVVERATCRTLIDFNLLADKLPIGDIHYAIDCQSAFIDRDQIDSYLPNAPEGPRATSLVRTLRPYCFALSIVSSHGTRRS